MLVGYGREVGYGEVHALRVTIVAAASVKVNVHVNVKVKVKVKVNVNVNAVTGGKVRPDDGGESCVVLLRWSWTGAR